MLAGGWNCGFCFSHEILYSCSAPCISAYVYCIYFIENYCCRVGRYYQDLHHYTATTTTFPLICIEAVPRPDREWMRESLMVELLSLYYCSFFPTLSFHGWWWCAYILRGQTVGKQVVNFCRRRSYPLCKKSDGQKDSVVIGWPQTWPKLVSFHGVHVTMGIDKNTKAWQNTAFLIIDYSFHVSAKAHMTHTQSKS